MLWKGFQRPKVLEYDEETLTDQYGRFHAQPFERGFGTTIGNALRRVLLFSIEGASVTAVKIDGVKCDDNKLVLPAGEYVVQVGKRKFCRITVA